MTGDLAILSDDMLARAPSGSATPPPPQLEVHGGAQVFARGDLWVYRGDGWSADDATFVVGAGATLTVSHQLELVGSRPPAARSAATPW